MVLTRNRCDRVGEIRQIVPMDLMELMFPSIDDYPMGLERLLFMLSWHSVCSVSTLESDDMWYVAMDGYACNCVSVVWHFIAKIFRQDSQKTLCLLLLSINIQFYLERLNTWIAKKKFTKRINEHGRWQKRLTRNEWKMKFITDIRSVILYK